MANDFKINEDQNLIPTKKKKPATGIIGLLIRKGVVKTAGQANALLILFIFVGLGFIIYLNIQTFGN